MPKIYNKKIRYILYEPDDFYPNDLDEALYLSELPNFYGGRAVDSKKIEEALVYNTREETEKVGKQYGYIPMRVLVSIEREEEK